MYVKSYKCLQMLTNALNNFMVFKSNFVVLSVMSIQQTTNIGADTHVTNNTSKKILIIDDNTIKSTAASTCKAAWRDAAIYMHGELTLDSLIKTLDLWPSVSHIPFRHITKNGKDRHVVQHELGEKWSKYFVIGGNSTTL